MLMGSSRAVAKCPANGQDGPPTAKDYMAQRAKSFLVEKPWVTNMYDYRLIFF